jgi:hypothetical protein
MDRVQTAPVIRSERAAPAVARSPATVAEFRPAKTDISSDGSSRRMIILALLFTGTLMLTLSAAPRRTLPRWAVSGVATHRLDLGLVGGSLLALDVLMLMLSR